MKILMVNKFLYPRGGSESYMLYLAEYLEKLGFKTIPQKSAFKTIEEAINEKIEENINLPLCQQ